MSKKFTVFGFFLISLTAFSYLARAQTITGRFSVDNGYQLWIGDSQHVQTQLAAKWNTEAGQIKAGVPVTFDAVKDCHIYIVAWSDDSQYQGLVGSFTGATTLKTGDSQWRVWATGQNLGYVADATATPSKTQVNTWLDNAPNPNTWPTPFAGSKVNDPFPKGIYGNVQGIDPNAQWVWHDSKKDSRAKWPNNPNVPFVGFNHDEVLIFRVPCPEPINLPDPCCPPWNSDSLVSMLAIIPGNNITSPYSLKFSPTQSFLNQMQAYTNYLGTIPPMNQLTIGWYIHDMGTGTNPSSGTGTKVGPDVWTTWTAGGTGPTGLNSVFDPSQHSLQVNHWYKISTWTYLEGGYEFFDEKCAGAQFFYRHQVQMRQGKQVSVAEIVDPSGRRMEFILPERMPQVLPLKELGTMQLDEQRVGPQDGRKPDGRKPDGRKPESKPQEDQQRAYWTPWLNRDNPGGKGDYETLSDFITSGQVQPNPSGIDCTTVDGGIGWREAGQVYTCDIKTGGVCINAEQTDGRCLDYQVRFLYRPE